MPRWDLHTHYYPRSYFRLIEETGGDFSFGKSPTAQTIVRFRGSRFFGITPPMTDPVERLEDMDRVGIDVEVLSLSTPNVSFAPPERQAEVARIANDAYAELIKHRSARHRTGGEGAHRERQHARHPAEPLSGAGTRRASPRRMRSESEEDRNKAGRLDAERAEERAQGIAAGRRGSRPAPSDRPENEPPHPQDVNEIGEPT